MSIKLLVLKSYEDVIADVKEMMSGDKVIGYLLRNPFVTRLNEDCLLYTSPSPRDRQKSRMPSSA